jgi:2-amino-4-hydroxy-6-hydroxymethyldihydropteridine diphosphokinase
MTLCHIALGGNLGDVGATFAAALEQLSSDDLRVVAVSRLYATPPMGAEAGSTFLNAAASIETSLDPLPLLDRLLAVEDRLGRRREKRWGPRAIDLDLIFFGTEIVQHPRLQVPHPDCWYRRFVLDPLDEIAPEAVHPQAGETVHSLKTRLLARPFAVGCDNEQIQRVLEVDLGPRFPAVVWIRDEMRAVLTLSRTASQNDPLERRIGLPQNGSDVVEAAQAVLVAALAEPAVCAASEQSVNDRSA